MPEYQLLPLPAPGSPLYRAVETIYQASFAPEEKVPFGDVWRWLNGPETTGQGELLALLHDGQPIGLGSYLYDPAENIAFWAYLAIVDSQRGQGHGSWLCRGLVERVIATAQRTTGQTPRLIYWEARFAEDAPTTPEREQRQARIRFYQRIGAVILPVVYLCPPLGPDLPAVRYELMAYLFDPARPLSTEEITRVVRHALLTVNHAPEDSLYVSLALQSIIELAG